MAKKTKSSIADNKVVSTILIAIIMITIIVGIARQTDRATSTLTNASSLDSNLDTFLNATETRFGDSDSVYCLNTNVYNSTTAKNVSVAFSIDKCYATLNNATINNTDFTFNYTKVSQSYIAKSNILRTLLEVGSYILLAIIILAYIKKTDK